ncbi:glycoside hydrolase family 64 protein [Streptomyces fuscigenes]|uniref:glycoside hydrolase family 64 protein n=1 Tax=Streptomyces fuscigenes TaxID=1528880 RepID=UPI001F18A273|nr:glycoside hydrolase family 64 protein [Streptomyces fuscigenes]MCF3963042.1 glycoside hydrolase family 64 protein [Streptomyces fuscigenes]
MPPTHLTPTAPRPARRRAAARLTAAVTMALALFGAAATAAPSTALAANAPLDSATAATTATTATTAGENPPDSFWGDTSSIPPAQNVLTVKVLNRTNGQYPDDQVYWKFGDEEHSIAEQPYVDMPANSAGRMYFYLGSPDSKYQDFIEFTVGDGVFNGNTTRVDAWALPLAMRLHASDGYDVQVGDSYDVFQQSRDALFQEFKSEVPTEFQGLADVQAPYSIPAPGSSPDFRDGGKYADYFTSYAQSVGVNESTSNITGCAGSLANNAQMCAALNRHVAQLPEDQQSDPGQYYKSGPANYYAKFWHDHGINGLAYGFPYDDVAGQSSFVSHADPQWLEVAVGF